jgi:hypothetical protein
VTDLETIFLRATVIGGQSYRRRLHRDLAG